MAGDDEVQRGRALLGAITRERLLAADMAARAYERWSHQAVEGGKQGFARFLIEGGWMDPEQVRLQLRRLTVQGLPLPDQFTQERLEDLLVCQLGIESDLLDAKLVGTVRKVQDKKVAEGKLRRVVELLVRAGVDPQKLAALQQHLRERILLCPGCLSRYPVPSDGRERYECPRCATLIPVVPLGLEASAELQVLPEFTRERLRESADRIYQSLPLKKVETREGLSPVALAVGAGVIVIGGLLGLALTRTAPPPPPPLVPRPSASPSASPSVSPSETASVPGTEPTAPTGAASLAELRVLEPTLLREGRYQQAHDLWERLEVGDDAALQDKRQRKLEELARLAALAERAAPLLAAAKGHQGEDPGLEARLAELLAQTLSRTPPFDAVSQALAQLRGRRQLRLRAEARAREQAARQRPSPEEEAWKARSDAVAKQKPLLPMGEGLRLVALSREGYRLQAAGGAERTLTWDEEPAWSVIVFSRLERRSVLDQWELYRLALRAREVRWAREAGSALELSDPAAPILAGALAAAPVRIPGGWRLDFPLTWLPPGLTARGETRCQAGEGGLELEGKPFQLEGVDLRLEAPLETLRIAAGLQSVSANELWLRLDLSGSERRSYRARWRKGQWWLELDTGDGFNQVRAGSVPGMPQRAALEVSGGQLHLELDGAERTRVALTPDKVSSARVALGGHGRASLTALSLEAPLSDPWVEAEEEGHRRRAEIAAVRARRALAGKLGGTPPPPNLADEAALRALDAGARGRLDQARQALLRGDLGAARTALEGLPALARVRLLRAELELQADGPGRASALLSELLEEDPSLDDATVLQALAQARARRPWLAQALAEEALAARPDRAEGYLASLRVALLGRQVGLPGVVRELALRLELPRALEPGSPLFLAEEAALETLARVESWVGTRAVGRHVVLLGGMSEQEAGALLGSLDALCNRWQAALGRSPLGPPLNLVVLSRSDAETVMGPALPSTVGANWDGQLDLLLCRQAPDLKDLRFLEVLARGWLRTLVGELPAWLEAGVVARLLELGGGALPAWIDPELAKQAWTPERWETLFAAGADALAADPAGLAKAHDLWRRAEKEEGVKRALGQALDAVGRGEPIPRAVLETLGAPPAPR